MGIHNGFVKHLDYFSIGRRDFQGLLLISGPLGDEVLPIRVIRIDGGSKFKKNFEVACRDQNIRLFVISPI